MGTSSPPLSSPLVFSLRRSPSCLRSRFLWRQGRLLSPYGETSGFICSPSASPTESGPSPLPLCGPRCSGGSFSCHVRLVPLPPPEVPFQGFRPIHLLLYFVLFMGTLSYSLPCSGFSFIHRAIGQLVGVASPTGSRNFVMASAEVQETSFHTCVNYTLQDVGPRWQVLL